MRSITYVVGVMIMLTFGIFSPAGADDAVELKLMIHQLREDYESRIKALEAKIGELEAGQKKNLEARIAETKEELRQEMEEKTVRAEYVGRHNAPVGDGGLVVNNPFGFGQVTLGGYYDMEYRDMNNSESTFRQHRWIINVGAQVHERIRFNSEYEIEYGGPNSAGGDGEAKVEQAYMDFLINDMINLRAGAVLAPFGRYNLYHDSDLQDLTDRPLVARDIIPTTWTESGYGVFGEFDPVIGSYEDLLIHYQLYAVNGLDAGFSDTGLRGGRNSLKTDNNDNKAIVGRVNFSPFLGHDVGVSGYWGEYDGKGNDITGIGVDTFDVFGPVEFVTEYAYFDVEESPTASSDLPNFLQGAMAEVRYHFWPEFLSDTFLGRGFDNPTFTLVGRYGWARIHDDGDATIGDNEERRVTIGINYRPVDSFVVKLEYQHNETDNEALEAGSADGFITSVALGF